MRVNAEAPIADGRLQRRHERRDPFRRQHTAGIFDQHAIDICAVDIFP